jgi:hypothetical protein
VNRRNHSDLLEVFEVAGCCWRHGGWVCHVSSQLKNVNVTFSRFCVTECQSIGSHSPNSSWFGLCWNFNNNTTTSKDARQKGKRVSRSSALFADCRNLDEFDENGDQQWKQCLRWCILDREDDLTNIVDSLGLDSEGVNYSEIQ